MGTGRRRRRDNSYTRESPGVTVITICAMALPLVCGHQERAGSRITYKENG